MNEAQCKAIVYGDSLILEGVRAYLASQANLEVLVWHHAAGPLLHELLACGPATLIFDIETIDPEFLLVFFREPGLQLIGIDPETHQALVWSGRQVAAVVAADLAEVLLQPAQR